MGIEGVRAVTPVPRQRTNFKVDIKRPWRLSLIYVGVCIESMPALRVRKTPRPHEIGENPWRAPRGRHFLDGSDNGVIVANNIGVY